MDNLDILHKIAKRLPPSWHTGWRCEANHVIYAKLREVSITDLACYVFLRTSNKLILPVTGIEHPKQEKQPSRIQIVKFIILLRKQIKWHQINSRNASFVTTFIF